MMNLEETKAKLQKINEQRAREWPKTEKRIQRLSPKDAGEELAHEIIRTLHDEKKCLALAARADTKTTGMDDMQLLSLAIHCNLPNIAKVLLERGADVHAADRWGRTALHITASKGYPGLAQELVQRGADVNARNTKKSTPLMFAVNEDCDKTANILIDHNADIDAQNEDGWTALIYAAKNIHLDSTRLLLARKANCEIEDNNGCTAHDHITAGRQPPEAAVIKFLLEESSLARIKEKFEAAAAAGTPQKRTIRRRPPTPGA